MMDHSGLKAAATIPGLLPLDHFALLAPSRWLAPSRSLERPGIYRGLRVAIQIPAAISRMPPAWNQRRDSPRKMIAMMLPKTGSR